MNIDAEPLGNSGRRQIAGGHLHGTSLPASLLQFAADNASRGRVNADRFFVRLQQGEALI